MTPNLSTATGVLTTLRAVTPGRTGTDLARMISACGAFVSGPHTERGPQDHEAWNIIGRRLYVHSDAHGSMVVTYPSSDVDQDMLREYLDWTLGPAKFPDVYGTRDPKVIVLGEVNPHAGMPPLWGPAGDRLREMIGLSNYDLRMAARAVNLLPTPLAVRPSMVPRRVFYRLHGLAVEHILEQGTGPVVVLGRNTLLGLSDFVPFDPSVTFGFETYRWRGKTLYLVPHPSGRNRHWNSVEARDDLRRLFDHILNRKAGT